MLGPLSLLDYGSKKRLIEPIYVWGLNFAIRKELLHECGGFHPDGFPSHLLRYRGDGETGLALKIELRGLQALYHPDAAVTHIIPASRLTVRAFEQRAFVQGISDSYTQIRRDGVVPPPAASIANDTVRPTEGLIDQSSLCQSEDVKVIRGRMVHAHAAGVEFHQNEVRNDNALLEWVLKANYFDYKLPAGWENHVRPTGKVGTGSSGKQP
jgi:hypothetical protein